MPTVEAAPPHTPSPEATPELKRVNLAKRALREHVLATRAAMASTGAGERLARNLTLAFADGAELPEGPIAAFLPMAEEIDPLSAVFALGGVERPICMPVLTGRGQPLLFRAWSPGDRVEPGPLGIRQPTIEAPVLVPRTLLVPLLAVDPGGWRLGYGGGYYDRTLALLRGAGAVLAIGVCFEGQLVDAVPRSATDQRLDWIATEVAAREAGEAE